MRFRKLKNASSTRSSTKRPGTLSGAKRKKRFISETINDRKYAEGMAFLYGSDEREITCMINSIDRMMAKKIV